MAPAGAVSFIGVLKKEKKKEKEKDNQCKLKEAMAIGIGLTLVVFSSNAKPEYANNHSFYMPI